MAMTGVTPNRLTISHVLAQVGRAGQHLLRRFLAERGGQRLAGDDPVPAGMHLERTHRRDDDRGVGVHAGRSALDVEELLGPDVGAEPGLGDQVVADAKADLVGQDARTAMRDIAERTGVDEGGRVFERLQQVGHERLAQDHRHRTRGLQLLRGHRRTVARVADHDPAEALAQIMQRGRQRKDRHDLGGGRDVESGLPRHPVDTCPEADHDVAQGPVIDVEDARPGDLVRVDAQGIAVEQVVVDHRGQQVVRSGNRMRVAGQVQVHPLHRHDLGPAAAGRATLDPEDGAHRRLPDRHGGALADVPERLREADRSRRLALPQWRRRDRGDHHVLGQRPVGELIQRGQLHLGHVPAVRLQQVRIEAQARRHLGYRLERLPIGRSADRPSTRPQPLSPPR